MTFYEDRAHLYDIAFSWDVSGEVDWLLARLGPHVKVVLEPACGSGRMFPAFAERGVEVVGVELSKTMITRARERMAACELSEPRILHEDMAGFDLGDRFDGAFCPIDSFAYLLNRERAGSHLACVAKHLSPGGKYMIQIELIDFNKPPTLEKPENRWVMERDGMKVATEWFGRSIDAQSRLETQLCRFEVVSGPGAGIITEDEHVLRRWDWDEWRALIDESPFALRRSYDGNSDDRSPVVSGPIPGEPLPRVARIDSAPRRHGRLILGNRRHSFWCGAGSHITIKGDVLASQENCEEKIDCDKKLKGRIDCPEGERGSCKKIKGKRTSCD